MIGEYEPAFYGSQYASMTPLSERYGVQLWMPGETRPADFASELVSKNLSPGPAAVP